MIMEVVRLLSDYGQKIPIHFKLSFMITYMYAVQDDGIPLRVLINIKVDFRSK